MFKKAALSAIALMAIATSANAQTVVQNFSSAALGTAASVNNFTQAISFNQFDATLGTLQSITFTFTDATTRGRGIVNNVMGSDPVLVEDLAINSSLRLVNPLNNNALVAALPVITIFNENDATDDVTVPLGSVVRFPAIPGFASATAPVLPISSNTSDAALLAFFTGNSTININLRSTANAAGLISGSSGALLGQESESFAAGTITFNFAPAQTGVPEPSAVAFAAIAGAGLVGMMVRARRK